MLTSEEFDRYVRYREAAHRGGILLDVHAPGWAGRVNPDRLRMSDLRMCVLGQGMPEVPADRNSNDEYLAKLDWLGLTVTTQVDYGFALSGKDTVDWSTWNVLADAWREEIKARTTTPVPAVQASQDDLVLVG